ncbi:MAG: hypothetical protein CMB80_31675 [Flammeovirgaceae bacterium]|nr:hypothetical protein [Flammeovirgaceae bacterium]|tara:strand:- start:1230 stop:2186 length:957 start_codon:yes stop_codon:yes gene_type:complete
MQSGSKRDDRVCVIIVSFNGMKWIDRCIQSLEQSGPEITIVMVDNGSTDGTTQHVRKNYPNVEITVNRHNLGFGAANNLALISAYHSGFDYFFLLNQDAWIEDGVLFKLVHSLKNNLAFGIVSPIHFNGKGTDYDVMFLQYVLDKLPNERFLDRGVESDICRIDYVNAAAWLISRKCIEKVGLFHPLFYHYGEDDNYIQRLHMKGLELGLVSNTYVYHDREDRGYNELKDSPKRFYQRESLRALLHPESELNGRLKYKKGIGLATSVSRKRSFLFKVWFYFWAFSRHSLNVFLRWRFRKNGYPGLYILPKEHQSKVYR